MKRTLFRLSTGVMAAIMALQALPVESVFAAATSAVLRGDVNGDGQVDAADLEGLWDLLDDGVATIFSEETAPAGDVTEDGLIDARDVYAMQQYLAGTDFPTEIPTMANDSVTLDLSGATVSSNGVVTMDLSMVDWTKDISAYDLLVRFDRAFTVDTVNCTGSGRYVVEGNAVKIYGVYTDKADWRGALATLQFHTTPDVKGDYCFFVDSAVVSDSAYHFYDVVKPNRVFTVNAPFAPVNLHADGVSSQSAALSWEMPFTQQTLSGYEIYRDDKKIAETADAVYLDTGLTEGSSYTYTVKGKTAIGGLTDACQPCVVTPAAPVIQSMAFSETNVVSAGQSDLTIQLAQMTLVSSLQIAVTAPDGTTTKKTVPMDGVATQTLRYPWAANELASGSYLVQATVVDVDDASVSAELTAELDNTPPAPVTLTAYAGGRTAVLTWTLALEADAAGYRVYRQDKPDVWTQIAAIDDRTVQDYTDTGLTVGTAYTYAVTAIDAFGTEGERSNAETVTPTEDVTIPEITLFTADKTGRVAGTLLMTQQAKDENGIASMQCLISADEGTTWEPIWSADTEQAVWSFDTTAYADGVYQLKAIATDTSGLESNQTNLLSFAIDNTAPEQVQNVRLDAVFPTQATLAWDDVAAEDFAYFLVLISSGGKTERRTVKAELGLNLTGLIAKTEYAVTVSAVDQCGNIGQASTLFRFITEPDVTAPVITGMSVSTSYIQPNGEVTISVYATDVSNVSTRYLQYSQDQETWVTRYLTDRYASFVIRNGDFTEGPLYFRAYAEDQYGNKGDPEEAEIQSILVDATPPDTVSDLTALMRDNGIALAWSSPEEETVRQYTLQRAMDEEDAADDAYTTLFERRSAVQYVDSTVESNHTYYYRIAAYDLAGNMSAFCEPVAVTFAPDTTAPFVKQCYLSQTGIVSAANNKLQIIAADAVRVDTMMVSYQCAGETEWTDLTVGEPVYNSVQTEVRCTVILPEAVLDATDVTIRVIAKDAAGNIAEPRLFSFVVNNTMIPIADLTATRQNNQIQLTWDCAKQEGLSYFTVYRTVNEGLEYVLQRIYPSEEKTTFSYADTKLYESGTYQYRVTALHENGNVTSVAAEPMAVQSVPQAKFNCFPSQQLGAAYLYDISASTNADEITSVVLDYGDGTCDTASSVRGTIFSHTYAAVGVYEVKLTCTNADGFSDTATATVTVEEPLDMAEVSVTVLTTDGKPAAYASVYLDVGTEEQIKYDTDAEGKISFLTTTGQHEVGAFGDGYLPVTKTCTFYSGKVNNVDFAVVCNQLVDATFHVTRMTLSEIIAAGINVEDPGNLQLVRIDVQLQYVSQKEAESLSIIYDRETGARYLSDSAKSSGYAVHSITTNKKKEIDAVVLMHIPVKAQMLKEFFNVEMIVINNAEEAYSIENCTATLALPQGLTLMESAKGSSPQNVELGTIAGKQNKTVNWIIRGDVEGSYPLSVDFSGTLAVFNEPIAQTFVADEKITVSGTSGLETTVNISNFIRKDSLFVELRMKNNSSIPYYHLSMEIGDVLVSALGSVIGEPAVSVYQTRTISKEGLLKVVELSNEIETLNPGETFSVLYCISYFSDEYAFTLLKALKETLQSTSSGGGKITVQIASEGLYVDTKSIFYGIVFDKDRDYLIAVRNKAGVELSNTQVTVEKIGADGTRSTYFTGYTDERGRVIFPRGESDVTYCVKANREGYLDYTDNAFAFPSNKLLVSTWLTLQGDLDTDAFTLSCAKYYLDGYYQTDLLQGSAHLAQKTEKTVKLYVSATGDVEHFELWQDNSRIAEVDAAGGCAAFEGLEADDFSQNEIISVRTYAASGDFLETKLNLTIDPPPADTASDVTDCISQQLGEGATVSSPFSCEFFSLDLTLKTPTLKGSNSYVSLTDDSMKITVNCDNDDPEHTSYKDFCFKKKLDWRFGSTITLSVGAGMILEAKQDTKEGKLFLAGSIFIKVTGSAKATVFEAFPVYFELELTASAQIAGQFSYTYYPDPAKQQGFAFALKGEFFIRIGGYLGLGAQGIANAGVYADAGFHIEGTIFRTNGSPFLDTIYFDGHVGIQFELFGFVNKIEFFKGKIVIYKNPQGRPPILTEQTVTPGNMQRALNDAITDTDNYYRAAPTDANAAWNGTLAADEPMTVLQENCYGGATPVTATIDGQTVMVWTQKDADRGSNNATHAVYSLYDAETNTWSAPVAVDDNLQSEYTPVLYTGTDGLYLTYQEAKKVYADDDALSLATYATDMTLTTAKFDPETKAFVPMGSVDACADGAYVSNPQYAEDADGNLYLLWTSNTDGAVFSENANNAICYATQTDDGWSAPQTLAANLPTVLDFAAGTDAEGALNVAYVTDPDCDLTDTSDNVLSLCTLGKKDTPAIVLAEGVVTNPSVVTLPGQETPSLVWMCNQSLYTLGSDNTARCLVDGTDWKLTGPYAVTKDSILMLCQQEKGVAVASAQYDAEADAFTSPVLLYAEDDKYYSDLQTVTVGADTLVTMLASTCDFTEETMDLQTALVCAKLNDTHQMTVSDVTFDRDAVVPGSNFPVSVTVTNDGTQTVNALQVKLVDADGKTVAEKNCATAISSGETTTVEVPLPLAADFQNGVYALVVTEKDVPATDAAEPIVLDLSQTDLVLETSLAYLDNQTLVTLMIRNDSNVPTSAVVSASLAETGEQTLQILSDEIAPHSSILWTVDAADLLGDNYHAFVKLSVNAQAPETEREDNETVLSLTKGDYHAMTLGDINYDGAIDANDASQALVMYTTGLTGQRIYETTYQQSAADVDGDGAVTASDAVLILNYYVRNLVGDTVDSFEQLRAEYANGGTQE